MHTVQTAADPPNHGRMILATSGWTWNSRNAERKTVMAYRVIFFAIEFIILTLLSAYIRPGDLHALPLRRARTPRLDRRRPGRACAVGQGPRRLSLPGRG